MAMTNQTIVALIAMCLLAYRSDCFYIDLQACKLTAQDVLIHTTATAVDMARCRVQFMSRSWSQKYTKDNFCNQLQCNNQLPDVPSKTKSHPRHSCTLMTKQ